MLGRVWNRSRVVTAMVVISLVAGGGAAALSLGGAEAATTTQAFFDGTTRPAVFKDTSPVNLGVKFSADVAGTVTGVRVYRDAADDVKNVFLWSAGGQQLGAATLPPTGS